jgi:FtsP/CotA-like multicopper oxidase with cupredoxin domain
MSAWLDVYVNDGLVRMVDDSLVYMRGFGDAPADGSPEPSLRISPRVFLADGTLVASRRYPLDAAVPEDGRPDPLGQHPDLPGIYRIRRSHWASFFPERTIIAESGSTIRLRVHNLLDQVHELAIDVPGPDTPTTGPIVPRGTAELELPAPAPGTYAYHDPRGGSVQRLLGLHGVLVVVDPQARWKLAPGRAEFERQWVWICQDVDPVWAARARAGETIDPVRTPPVPRYFMLNDRSGYRSLAVSSDSQANKIAHEDTLPSGSAREVDVRDFSPPSGAGSTTAPGQLIRLVNMGAVIHQMHFHGNHQWTIRRNGVDFPRSGGRVDPEGHVILQQWEDVIELDPLDRKEIVLPLRRPPDATDRVWAARAEDWPYPMHCHAEPSQTAAGGLYPGGLVADWTLAAPGPRRDEQHATYPSQAAFASNQPNEGSPTTRFRETPDKRFLRDFFSRELRFPDGREFEIWSFEDERSGRRFPAPLMRMTEGDLVHVLVEPSKRVHTIHHHGVEPDPRNDGVGHTSFEVTGSYTYQFRPETGTPGDAMRGSAGSYFYHCHVNTPLHVQMGMAGPLIVDPVVHPHYPVPAGARRAFVDGPLYDIATEALLVPFAVDPRWHEMNHAAGLSGEDVGLNRFDPRYFYVVGGALSSTSRGEVIAPTQLRVNMPASGYPTLFRMENFNFYPSRAVFRNASGHPVPMAEVIAHDGRPFRDTSRSDLLSPAVRDTQPATTDRPSPLMTDAIAFGAAERYDLLLHPPARGTYTLVIEFYHWVNKTLLGTKSVSLDAR